MSQIVLGKVAFVDKGVYATASTYNTFDFVVTDDSCYLCVKDGNKNHPLTDTAWWKCIARGTQATEAAKTALAEANKAIEATRNAISAAGLANAKALEAGKQADLAGRAIVDESSASCPYPYGAEICQEDNVRECRRPEDSRESFSSLCIT